MKRNKLPDLSLYARIYFFLLFCGLGMGRLMAQSLSPDLFTVVLNKPFYVSGETIWYAVYQRNSGIQSRVIHAGVFDHSGKLLTDQTLRLTDGEAHGSIDIPIEWPDDTYRLEIMTRWNLNFGGAGITEIKIPVYNSSRPGTLTSSDDGTGPSLTDDYLKEIPEGLNLSFDKTSYRTGDSVVLTLQPTRADRSFSVSMSVLDYSQIASEDYPLSVENKSQKTIARSSLSPSDIEYQPEKALTLEAFILNQEKTATITSNVLSVYISGMGRFLRTASVNGKLETPLPDFYNDETIQVFNMNPFQEHMPSVKQVRIWDHLSFGELNDPMPAHTVGIDNYILHAKLRRKINEIFSNELSQPVFYGTSKVQFPEFDQYFEMSKFKLLTNLDDFIKSVILNKRRYKDNGNLTYRLFNNETDYYFTYHPWYLVDGLFTYDEPMVLTTPFSSLYSVGFYTNYKTIYRFDPLMIMNGIIAVSTTDRHWNKEITTAPNTFQYAGFNSSKSFGEVKAETFSQENKAPDLNPVVYWKPDIKTGNGQSSIVRFRTTDNPGLFLLKIEGVDEKGNFIRGVTAYKVTFK